MEKISVIIPCLNEEDTVHRFYDEMERVRKTDFEGIDFEYIFVDDGSTDGTLDIIKDIRKNDKKVRFLSFSRNFGKEAAIIAGLKASDGDYVTLMDSDLQDPPALLREMYDAIVNEGYDQVGTRRVTRKGEPRVRSFFARNFYRIINAVSDVKFTDGARDYRLMKRCVVDAILSIPESNRFSKGIFSYVGYRTKWLTYENIERVGGKSKWSFASLLIYAIGAIVSFSGYPLAVSLVMSALFFIASIVMFALAGILGNSVFLICGAVFISSSAVLASLSIMGKYIAQSSTEVKGRPLYFVRESDSDTDEKNGKNK